MAAGVEKRRLGLGKVLGTENTSDLMTKHVDAKLLAEHCRCMGCELVAGRDELAPQVVQEIEDIVDFVEDVPSGLMTASASREPTTDKNHCAPESELCLPLSFFVRRSDGDHCRGGDERGQGNEPQSPMGGQLDRPRLYTSGQSPSWAPAVLFSIAVGAVSFEGRCLF